MFVFYFEHFDDYRFGQTTCFWEGPIYGMRVGMYRVESHVRKQETHLVIT